jgi:hypothetical protein
MVMNANGISLKILSADDVLELAEEKVDYGDDVMDISYDSLTSYIVRHFDANRRNRDDSRIEREIFNSLRAFNGEYNRQDLQRIKAAGGGSQIFMNLTATKCRAAKSWISDIVKPALGKPWSLEPTPVEDLPKEMREMLRNSLAKEFEALVASQQQQPQPPQEGPPQQGQPQQSPVEQAQEGIRNQNQKKRDIETAIADEITKEAKYQLSVMERKIEDQLKEGDWDQALSDFLDHFVVFPTAFLKGPIVQRKRKLIWKEGEAQTIEGYKYHNEVVHPIDMYPSPAAKGINDGNLCEHLRLDLPTIESMKGVDGYNDEEIDNVIEEHEAGITGKWLETDIEQEKAQLEKRGSFIETNRDTIHGIHFWGPIKVSTLREWEFHEKIEDLEKQGDNDIVQIEAILVGNHVIKCVLNDDPLNRRPYFKASFMNIPGSFWGRSLPNLMSSTQRMCNAVARALANNLGIASGPQVELYIDRLADGGDIEEVVPFKIWQLRSDPTGAGGRAINFYQPQSNAGELLKVYDAFESKADDITGVPKYAYGNENSKGMTQTAQGLAMLLETTSKIIKDCIRNIDDGVFKPRIMLQFHRNMLDKGEDFNYTGDINVCTIGSNTMSIKSAEATKRNEFLQATGNPQDINVMGYEARAEILRKQSEDLGMPGILPTNYEIRKKMEKQEADNAKAAQENAKAEQMKVNKSLEATKIQIDGQERMHAGTMQKDMAKMQLDMEKFMKSMEMQMGDLVRKIKRDQSDAAGKALEEDGKDQRQNQEVALKLTTGKEGI